MTLQFKDPDEKGVWACVFTNQLFLMFEKDDSGRIIEMRLAQAILMPRNKEAQIPIENVPEKYKPLVGSYLFKAINAEIKIIYQDGSLTLQDPDGDIFGLEYSEEKGIWESINKKFLVEFQYDKDGLVTGIKATNITRLPKI
jgi:hypothetical protein